VGLTGWSRSGLQTYYAVTHPGRVPLAAAVAADFMTGTYATYLADYGAMGPDSPHSTYEAGPGGPFWKHKSAWLEYEPSFNVDRVVTPLLITKHGNSDAELGGAITSTCSKSLAFLLNDKPLDYLYLPQSDHSAVRPRERVALMEGVVDWMAFWLQDTRTPVRTRRS